ncbi:MAG: hypothetical protein JWM11_7477 [Planctomycetaceae bacterium]|nr:hypothetical protein [Planctomycetaceae bacterium]
MSRFSILILKIKRLIPKRARYRIPWNKSRSGRGFAETSPVAADRQKGVFLLTIVSKLALELFKFRNLCDTPNGKEIPSESQRFDFELSKR